MGTHNIHGLAAAVGDPVGDLANPVGAEKTSDGTLRFLQVNDIGELKVTTGGGGPTTVTNDGTFAFETGGNLDDIKSNTDNLDVALSTRASEATLLTAAASLASIAAEDFATETTLAALNAKFNSLGQKTMAASAPVVIASDQSAIAVTGPLTDVQLRATPIPVSATDLDIRDLVFATDKVDVSGSSITATATDLDIRNLVFATDKVDVSGSSVTVSATDLDIRNLVFATDKVDVSGSTLGSNSGVDIGDVTINNGSGGSAVNIQDGGNVITVDGTVTVTATDLDIRNLVFATDKVDVSGSTLGSNSGVDIGDVTINNASGGAAVNIQDGGNSITVDGVVSTKTDLTPSSPTAASVGISSAQALASNANRKGLHVVNTSTNYISIAFGATAVLYSGITLNPSGGSFWMDEYCFDTGAVNAIASGASSNLAVQEFTT